MQTVFNILASMVIFSLLIMLVMNIDGGVKLVSRTLSTDRTAQEQIVNIANLIDHDFVKIGFLKSGTKLKVGALDSNKITFYSDIDNNGSVDSVTYFFNWQLNTVKSNPNIHPLFRKINEQDPQRVGNGIVYFNLTYFDKNRNEIGYSKLSDEHFVKQIRAIRVRIRVETLMRIEEKSGSSYWEKIFFPKNLNL